MVQIAIRLPDEDLEAVDELVASGVVATRAEAIRRGVALLLADAHEQQISDAYRRAYADRPLSSEDERFLDGAAADALRSA